MSKQSDVPLRYAKALFHLGTSQKELDDRLHMLEETANILNKEDIYPFFASPKVTQQEKIKLIEKSLKGHIDQTLLSFLQLLFTAGRFHLLPEIIRHYRQLVIEQAGIVTARLITATPIDATTRGRLQRDLEKRCQKNIVLKEEVDPNLIGGGVLFIGNTMIDFSLRNKLNELKEALIV